MKKVVRTLVEAGFRRQDVTAALARTGGDPDEATLLLLGDELAPARVMRRKPPDWGGALPQEVLEVRGGVPVISIRGCFRRIPISCPLMHALDRAAVRVWATQFGPECTLKINAGAEVVALSRQPSCSTVGPALV